MPGLDRLTRLSGRRWGLLLIGVALITRLAWVIALAPREPRWDEVNYIHHATALAEGKGYVDNVGRPTAYWPVGYPALLAVAYRVGGHSGFTEVTLQLIVGVATCALVGVLGSLAFNRGIGRASALLLAVYPNHVFYTTLRMTEPVFTLLLVAAAIFLIKSLTGLRSMQAAAGLTLGLAAMVRPQALLVPLAIPIWYWLRGWPLRRVLAGALVVGLSSLLTMSPWLFRNHRVTGSWLVLSTTGGHNFWMGNHPGALGGVAYDWAINDQLRVNIDYDYGNDYSRGYRLGLDAIAASPVQAAVRALQKVTYFFGLETDGVLWNLKALANPPPRAVTLLLLAIANIAYLFAICFAALGLVSTSSTNPLRSLLLVLMSCFVLMAIVFVGDPRYHYAILPLAAIFAVKAVVEDWPGLSTALSVRQAPPRQYLMVWRTIVVTFVLLIIANVILKTIEFRAVAGSQHMSLLPRLGL